MTELDVGYFYCPYIPITRTPVLIDPEEFDPQAGILTRYGRRLLEEGEQWYGTVNVQLGGEAKVNWQKEGF